MEQEELYEEGASSLGAGTPLSRGEDLSFEAGATQEEEEHIIWSRRNYARRKDHHLEQEQR